MSVDVSPYLDLPYSLLIRLDVGGTALYDATHWELLGCRGQGATPDEATADLREARKLYLGALLEAGLDVPLPCVLTKARPAVLRGDFPDGATRTGP